MKDKRKREFRAEPVVPDKGTCPVCGRKIRLAIRTGKICPHHSKAEVLIGDYCPGSGEPPTESRSHASEEEVRELP